MAKVKEEIEKKQSLSSIGKKNFWKIIKASRFPIILGLLVTYEGFFEVFSGQANVSVVSFARTGIFSQVAKNDMKRGKSTVIQQKIEQQYNEVAKELKKLQDILVNYRPEEDENREKLKKQLEENFEDKELGYTEVV